VSGVVIYPLRLFRRALLRLAAPKRKPPAPSRRLSKATLYQIAATTSNTGTRRIFR
jgi:hypothetical protein